MPYKKVEKTCKGCNEKKIMRKNRKFCSQECYLDYRKRNGTAEMRECKECGKEFKVYGCMIENGWGKGIYCSKECYHKGEKTEKYKKSKEEMGKKKRGENHHNWKGGKGTEYGRKERNRKEYKEWRRKVFERDHFTCQICEQKGGDLEADHIIPWAVATEKQKYDVKNGRTLCKECHHELKSYTELLIKQLKAERRIEANLIRL